jgi:SAM-dependent methyltransferase
MYLISAEESRRWSAAGAAALEGSAFLGLAETVRPDLRAPFHYYIGSLLAARGDVDEARVWLQAGADDEPVPGNSYLLDLIDRHQGSLVIPEVVFSDPRPWGHFSNLPALSSARQRFIEGAASSLPLFEDDLAVIDVGCGSGELAIRLARALLESRKAPGVGAFTLLDPSPAMLELASSNVRIAFPGVEVLEIEATLQEAQDLGGHYDISIASSSVHHMPAEAKALHLARLGDAADHFLLSELEANHDYPELASPEIALSTYQVFGRGVQWIFEREAPVEVQRSCADAFLMKEAVSLLTEPRGARTEYHMLRREWQDVLGRALDEFECVCEMTCYADRYVEQFMMHYLRAG